MIRKAIIPVAGLGTRFLPATKAQPKEMLAIVDKPVIQYLVEEAVASGIREIIFVTGRSKRAIEDHFDYSPELELALLRRKKDVLVRQVRAISNMAKFAYVRQKEARGDGDALLAAAHLVGNEPVAVLFGDDVVESETPALAQMITVFQKHRSPVIALDEVPWEIVHQYGVVEGQKESEGLYRIKSLVEKPQLAEAPSNLAIVGKYIITPDVFDELRRIRKPRREEVRLADALERVVRNRTVYGLRLQGKRYDCGSKIGFLKATVDFALKHEETRREFAEYLKGVCGDLDRFLR